MTRWSNLQEGAAIRLPGFEEPSYEGSITLRLEDNGWLRFGGTLKNAQGTFSLHVQSGEVAGTILLPAEGIGLEIRTEPSGEVLLVERRIGRILCWPALPQAAAAPGDSTVAKSNATVVPQINTRPGAKGLIYLNFSGGTITDPDWNGGTPINAAPSGLNAEDIKEVIARVSEDYAPFDMAISTIPADYESVPPGRRMRVIITPTNQLQSGAGGLSLIGSWPSSGRIRSSTIPAWVFNSTTKTIAEAISHEIGHTLGLSHDGTLGSEYYSGNGAENSPTNWAPIMGNSYSRALTQWSKGEYLNANNLEDDLAIIASTRNGVGYGTNAPGSVSEAALSVAAGTFIAKGVLRRAENPDRFQFTTTGGSLSITAAPVSPKYTNVDLQLELYKQTPPSLETVLVAKANPPELLESVLHIPALTQGTYQILVRSAGSSAPTTGVYTSGFSPYGSLGPYQINGTLEKPVSIPSTLSVVAVNGIVGQSLTIPIPIPKETKLAEVPASLPPGLVWDSKTTSLRGTPTKEGFYDIKLSLLFDKGKIVQPIRLFVDYPGVPLPSIDGALGTFINSPLAPWAGQLVPFTNNIPVRAAVSGRTANAGSSKLQLKIPGNRIVSFWWRTSSEAGHDGLECCINGLPAKDLDTGKPLKISGETSWVRQKIRMDAASSSILEFSYNKDKTLSEGEDRGWIANVEVGTPPVLKKSPPSVVLKASDKTFTLSAVVENATSFQWKKDGVPLVNGSLGAHQIAGATTQALNIKGVQAADSGAYTLESKNNFTTVTSPKTEIVVPVAPVILRQTAPTAPVNTGDTLLLGIEVAGAPPFVSSWKKNGQPFRQVTGTLLKVENATTTLSGTYSVSVSNSFGTSASKVISVTVTPKR